MMTTCELVTAITLGTTRSSPQGLTAKASRMRLCGRALRSWKHGRLLVYVDGKLVAK